jgi:hypothetical protein
MLWVIVKDPFRIIVQESSYKPGKQEYPDHDEGDGYSDGRANGDSDPDSDACDTG